MFYISKSRRTLYCNWRLLLLNANVFVSNRLHNHIVGSGRHNCKFMITMPIHCKFMITVPTMPHPTLPIAETGYIARPAILELSFLFGA